MFPEFDNEIIDEYTCGLCWSLAWHLHRVGGWPIAALGTFPDDWRHVVVRVGEQYLDVEGLHSRDELERTWKQPMVEYGDFPNRPSYVRTVWGDGWGYADRDYRGSRTAAIARKLAACV